MQPCTLADAARQHASEHAAGLGPADIRAMVERLPRPVTSCRTASATFDVYRVKRLHDPMVTSPLLGRLVVEARHSYSRYGDVPLVDSYDLKSAIYLVRARYEVQRFGSVEEWFSTRIVPLAGTPPGSEDLWLFSCDGSSAFEFIRAKGPGYAAEFMATTVASSRSCGILPFATSGLPEAHEAAGRPRLNVRFAGIAFALIHQQSILDSKVDGRPWKRIALSATEDGVKVIASVRAGGRLVSIARTKAHEYLGVDEHRVRLDRRAFDLQAYRYPGYFLDIDDVIEELRALLRDGRITDATLTHYLGPHGDLSTVSSKTALDRVRAVGTLLSADGPIAGAAISGDELRARLDRTVHDKAALYITDYAAWARQIGVMLEAAGIDSGERAAA